MIRNQRQPSGTTSIIAVGTLLMLGLVGAALLRLSWMQDRRAREDERQAQADWLVEAGLERAGVKLRANPDYAGETWTIPAERLGGKPGRVVLAVSPVGGEARASRIVRVASEFPAGDPAATRSRRDFRVEIGVESQAKGRLNVNGGGS